jgi:formylglycine-generating enzyme required for sulfatase activity
MKRLKALICGLAFTLPALLMICFAQPAEAEKADKEEKAVKEGGDEGGETREAVDKDDSRARTSWTAGFRTGPQEEITNSVGMRLRLIPAGRFMMGAVPGDDEASDKEKPRHSVEISKAFYIGVYEVTQAEWEAVMGKTQRDMAGDLPLWGEGPRHPVKWVNWDDAVAFCRKLSQKEGATYRLPTEAEWEYACRAGSTTNYYWGDSIDGDYAWYNDNSGGQTNEVGRKRPNAWGLYDMAGNVMEWCQDWYEEDYYSGSPSKDPAGPSSSDARVLRGGSWSVYPEYLRSSLRDRVRPDVGSYSVGFRVVREVE